MFTYIDVMEQVQVQLRVPREIVSELDRWVDDGKFASRSDAIKTIIALYEEKEKTKQFAKMLMKRSKEVTQNPKILVPL